MMQHMMSQGLMQGVKFPPPMLQQNNNPPFNNRYEYEKFGKHCLAVPVSNK